MALDILNTPTMLNIVAILTNGGTQPRAGIDQATVDEYAEEMAQGAKFPPMDVMYDGKDYWLIDGYHRLAAYKKNGYSVAPCHITQGTLSDAQWQSYGANARHGLRRSNEDKKRAVIRALQHVNAKNLSDEQIAMHVGVHRNTVLNYRRQLAQNVQDSDTNQRTVTRGDQTYTMNTAKIGAAKPEDKFATVDDLTRHIGSWLSKKTGIASEHLEYAAARGSYTRRTLEAFLRERNVKFANHTLEDAIAEVMTNVVNTVGPNATVTGPMPTMSHKDVADLKKAQAATPPPTDNTSLSVEAPTIERTASGLPRMTLIEHALTHEDDFYPLSQKQVDELVKQFETEGWKFYQVGDNWQAIHHHDQVATPILVDVAELLDALDDGNYTAEWYFIDDGVEPLSTIVSRFRHNLDMASHYLGLAEEGMAQIRTRHNADATDLGLRTTRRWLDQTIVNGEVLAKDTAHK